MNIFELSASLGLDTAQFTKGLEGAGGALSSFTGGLSTALSVIGKVDNAITSLGDAALKGTTSLVSTSLSFAKALDDNVMGVVDNLSDSVLDAFSSMATAGVNFVRDFVSEGMQFDAAMGNAGAIALKARDDFDQATVSVGNFTGNLRDYAKMLGATTKFTASQSAEALQFMFLAGYDEQTSAEMLPKVLDLAAAGAMDLGMASDMVTDAQTALGISMEDMTFFVDQMAKTASSSNTSVQQLGDALLSLGATGRMVHGGFEELNLALAVLANNGKKGSEGGNDLRRMLTRLVNPTKEALGWFDKLGISIYDSSTGQLKALPDLFTELSNAMSGLTEKQRNLAVSDIFGQYALAGANALLNTSAEKWTELRERIHDANGAAHEMADIQLETLSGQITLLQSALSGVKIALFDKLALPDLKDYVISLSTGFSHLADDLENGEYDKAFTDLGETVATLITKSVTLFLTNKDEIQKVGESFITFLDKSAQSILDAGVETIPTFIRLATSLLSTLLDNVAGFISDPQNLSKIKVTIDDFLNVTFKFFEENEGNFYTIFSTIFDLGVSIFSRVFVEKRKVVYTILFEKMSDILSDLSENLGTYLNSQETEKMVNNVLKFIGNVLSTIIGFSVVNLPKIVNFGLDIAHKVLYMLSSYLSNPENLNQIKAMINLVLLSIENFLEENYDEIKEIFDAIWEVGITFFLRVWELRRKTTAKLIFNKFYELFNGGWKDKKEELSDGQNSLSHMIGHNLLDGIIDGFIEKTPLGIFKLTAEGLTAIVDGIASFFEIKSPSKLMRDKIGKNLALGIGVGFEEQIDSVANEMASSIPDNFGISPEITTVSKNGAMDVYNFEIHIGTVNGTSAEDAQNLGEQLSQILYDKIYREKAAII